MQQGCGEKNRNEQGGFVAVLHTLEEQFYGPESPLDAKGRIFLYIRHRALRDWTIRKQIPKHEIQEATGLKPTALKDALRSLEKSKHLLVTRIKVGKIWGDNIYELHPDRYGKDYVFRPDKPTFKLIYGSNHKSNPSKKIVHRAAESYPQSQEVGPKTDLGVGRNTDLGVGVKTDLGETPKNLESLENSPPKNPLKEPFKKTLSEEVNFLATESDSKDKEAARSAREKLLKIFPTMLKAVP